MSEGSGFGFGWPDDSLGAALSNAKKSHFAVHRVVAVRFTPKALTLLDHRQAVLVLPNVRAKATAEVNADWPRKDDTHWTWSGQAVFAVAGRRLSEGLGVTCAT